MAKKVPALRLNVDTRAMKNQRFEFRPGKTSERNGPMPNPRSLIADVTKSARIFLGFSVGDVPTFSLDDVVGMVKKLRAKQGQDPDATFFTTKGLYTERRVGSKSRLITEDGCQIIMLNFGQPDEEFEEQMSDLCESLCRKMKQDKVFLEFQKNGISQGVWEVTA